MNVSKGDLIRQLMKKHNYTKASATCIVEDFTNIIADNMRAGNPVTIYGFGTFDIIKRATRSCPGVYDGKTYVIPEHWVLKFNPGEKMRRAVKMWNDEVGVDLL